MFNKLLGDFINGAISAHTSRIRNQDVSLKLFQNSLKIAELELYKFALFQYGIPAVIKCGIIKNIEVVVPWASFQSDDVKITIDDIFILASFPSDDPTNFISDQDIYDIREHQLAAHHEFTKRFYKILNQISSQKLSQIAMRVMHSCSIKIKNLHIRIEIDNQTSTNCHSLGFITSSIDIFTPKPSKGIPPVIEKKIKLNGLSIYLDLNQDYLHYQSIEEFTLIMKAMSAIDENHQFLLEPSSISANMTSSTEIQSSSIDIITDLNDIVLSITKKQLPVISKMSINAKKFCQFMFFKGFKQFNTLYEFLTKKAKNSVEINNYKENASINTNVYKKTDENDADDEIKSDEKDSNKPDNDNDTNVNNDIDDENSEFDPSLCWLFFHSLSKKKNDCRLDSIHDRILYRNIYIKEWSKLGKKTERTPIMLKLDHQLDYQAILFFQAVAHEIKQHGMKINYDEIYRFVGFDPLLLIPSFASRFSIAASASTIKVKFLNQIDKYDFSTILTGPLISYYQNHLHIDLQSFNMILEENETQYNVLKTNSPKKNLVSIDAIFQSFTKGSVTVIAEPLNLNADLTRILSFVSMLDLNLIYNTISKIKIEQNYYQIDIDLKEIHFLPILQDNLLFDIGFKSFSVHQNKSDFKEYFVLFNDVSFSHSNFYIFNNLNIKASAFHGALNVNIPHFIVNLFKKNFEMLDEVKKFLQSASILSQKAPDRLENLKIELNGIDINSDLLKNQISLGKSEMSYIENLYQTQLKLGISRVEVGFIVIENLLFEFEKEPQLIQSSVFVNQFYFKEIQIDINYTAPFLKGTYNHTKETMDLNFGVDKIEIKNQNSLVKLKLLINDMLLLTNFENKDNKSHEEDENTFLKSILNLLGNKKLQLTEINLTIHYVSRPITIIYNKLNIFIDFEWSLLLKPFVFSLSIPKFQIFYEGMKNIKIKELAFVFSETLDINFTALLIRIDLDDKIIQEMKNQFIKLKPKIKKLGVNLNVINKYISKSLINIQQLSIKLSKILKKYTIKVPLTQLLVRIENENEMNLTTSVSIKCSDIGLKTEPFNFSLDYQNNDGNKSIDLQIKNTLKINFWPLESKKFVATDNIYYVNQTGIDLTLEIDDNSFIIPDNSSYIASRFPINPKICFSDEKSKSFIDISRLWGDQSIPCFLNSNLILVWKTKSLLIFSSPLEILNTTGCDIQLLDECFQNTILPNNQIMFVDPSIEFKMKEISLSFKDVNLKVKAKLIKDSYTIKGAESYFRFIVERNSTTLVARVTITATVFIRSFFIEPILIEFEHEKRIILYPNIKVPIYFYDINESKISFKLSSLYPNGFFKDNKYDIHLSLSTGDSTISLNDPKHKTQTLYLRSKISEENVKDNLIKTVDISAPILFINQTGLDVYLSQNQDVKALEIFNECFPPNDDSLFKPLFEFPKYQHVTVPYCLNKDVEVAFFLSYPPTLKYTKNKFGVNRFSSNELALIPTSLNDETVIPVTFLVTHDETSTATIILKPYVVIYNNTNQTINIDKKPLNASEFLIVRSVSETLDVVVDSHGLKIPLNLQKISSFSVSGPSIQLKVHFTVSYIDDIKYITVSTVDSLGLFVAINETDKDFIINQLGMETRQYFVLSQASLLFDLSDTRTECSIQCFSEGIPPFTVQLEKQADALPIPGMSDPYFYRVEIVGEQNRYAVHFYSEQPTLINENFLRRNFFISVPTVSLKLIGKNFREYCRVTLGFISFHLLHQHTKESVALSVEAIQVDDMNEFADHPVVLLSVKKPFFRIASLRTIGSSFFDYIICEVTPLAAEVDVSFVIDMISLFNVQNNFKENDHKLTIEDQMNIITTINKDATFHCFLLDILPIDFDLSFFTRTPRQVHRFEAHASIPRFLSIIPTIENFQLQLGAIKAADINCSPRDLQLILVDNAKSSFSTQWLRLIGSVAIIGNPQKLIMNFSSAFKSPAKKVPKELLLGTAGSLNTILKSGETMMKGLSSTFRSVSHDDGQYISDSRTALGGFSWGVKSFVSGVAKAATGIVTKPIEMAKENGFSGAIKGASEGIVGIVTNSVGGAVDLTAGILTGVRRGIFREKVPKRVEEPLTKRRAYVTQMSNIRTSDSSVQAINRLVFVFVSDEADICEDVVFVGENQVNIDSIDWVEKVENSNVVKIDTKNNKMKEVLVKFADSKDADQFCSVLQLQMERRMTQKIFTIPY